MYLLYLKISILFQISKFTFYLIFTGQGMSAVFKTTILSIIIFIIYKYVIQPVSMPETEDFKKESGKIMLIIMLGL